MPRVAILRRFAGELLADRFLELHLIQLSPGSCSLTLEPIRKTTLRTLPALHLPGRVVGIPRRFKISAMASRLVTPDAWMWASTYAGALPLSA